MPLSEAYLRDGVRTKKGARVQVTEVVHFDLDDALALSTNAYLTTLAGPNTTTITPTLNGARVTAGEGRPDKPRNVTVTVTHGSAVVAESGTITGFADTARRLPITEDWSVTAGGTSKSFTGKKSFAIVTRITITAASDASANSNVVGMGKVFGIVSDGAPVRVSAPKAILELDDASVVTNGTVVAASTVSTDDAWGTYSPSNNPDGSKDFDAWILSDSPARS
jgi:hypothetical protein